MEEEDRGAPKDQQLTKKEFKALKRQQKEKERFRYFHQKKIKKFLLIFVGVLIISGGIFAISKIKLTPSQSAIISRQGIHWHLELSIKILGQKMEIPANIGLGITEMPIHTHDDMGVIHLEFPGLVRKDDIALGKFFEIWSKKFNKDCIFDKCSGTEGQLKMLVNGEQNFEFENYAMKDGDKIEIIFE